jgi:hypothetical protein
MSTTPSIDASTAAPELTLTELAQPSPRASLVVCLPEMPSAALETTLAALAAIFPEEDVQIALPGALATADQRTDSPIPPHIAPRIVPYPVERTATGWMLTASDYAAAASLAGEDTAGQRSARAILLLGDPSATDNPELLRRLAAAVHGSNVDLAVPRFALGPSDGLVNSAILFPLTRALFGANIRLPLPIDAALSARMVHRLASTGRRQVGQGSSIVWPVAEAAIAGFSVRQVETPTSPPPISSQEDFNALFNSVTGSLFADIEAKASFWQRARSLNPPTARDPLAPAESGIEAEIQPMIESFHLAQANLQEIWALVLAPQSRLALKKLSLEPPAEFALDPALWARVVYDFVLAFHLRTLNRGHLLGALIPLYLAWVASHLRAANDDPARSAHHTEETASAFETEKPYLVSRWRWPDRFNP